MASGKTERKTEIDAIFSDSNFQSIEVVLTISNVTTRTEFKKDPPALVSEMYEKSLLLEAAPKGCAMGHSLLIEMLATPPGGDPVKFSTTARVDALLLTDDGRERIAVALLQYEEHAWEAFRELFTRRQDEINRFLASAPGLLMNQSEKELEIFRKFIATKKIVIADESASSRSGVFGIFAQLGAKPFQIALASTMADAKQEIATRKPDLVIAEYNFGKSCGLDLIQTQRAENPEAKNCIFLLLTGNTSQSAVARAAEEDVDAFIIKPFTPEIFRKTIIKAALFKMHPPEYFTEIEAGKLKLADKNFEGAEASFKKAMTLDPQPALACYYLGQTAFLKKTMDEAKGSYQQGLDYNKIHYKCMVGLYELLMDLKLHAEAYEVVKKISQYFPANPKRLAEVLRLAIMTKSYQDVEKYYAMFCNIDERNGVLVDYICAALVVCGKYYLKTNNRSRALELFQKALATSAGRVKIIREIIQSLIDGRLANEARKFMDRYPLESQGGVEFLLLDFQICNLTEDPRAVLGRGKVILDRGGGTEKFYEIMLTRAFETKSHMIIENLLHECDGKFPAIRAQFSKQYEQLSKGEALLKSPKATA